MKKNLNLLQLWLMLTTMLISVDISAQKHEHIKMSPNPVTHNSTANKWNNSDLNSEIFIV